MTATMMASKTHFLVFCAIFLALVVLLGLGAWHTRAEIERHGAVEQDDASSPGSGAPPAPRSIRRLADPPPSPRVSTDKR